MQERIYKFRAWDKKEKKMITENFSVSFDGIPHDTIGHLGRNHKEGDIYEGKDVGIVIMQFTGLKDKSGNEIYEGDVVEGLSLRNFKVKEVVNWDKFQWFPFAGHWGLRDFEVIGNIYSNPELTK